MGDWPRQHRDRVQIKPQRIRLPQHPYHPPEVGRGPEALGTNVSGFLLLSTLWVPFFWIFPRFILSLLPASPFLLTFPTLPLPTAFQGPTSYHAIQISSFINSSWAQTQGSGWLGDVQIHGWDSAANRAVFLKPWSKGNFSDEEVTELEELIQVYLNGFFLEVQDHASEFQMECESSPPT